MNTRTEKFTVDQSHPDLRLDVFLREKFPVASRGTMQRLIEQGHIRINGQPTKATHAPRAGEEIEVHWPDARPAEAQPENIPLEILFEDEHILVVNKPQGLTVHPSDTQPEGTLVNALLHHMEKSSGTLSGIGGILRPGIVHRLDKDTSGVLLITKTDQAHIKMSEVFSKHAIERAYLALVYGVPAKAEQTIQSTLGRSPQDRKKIAMNVEGGRKAVTHLKLLEEFRDFASLLELRLETGRTHQIRVHLTGIGHSVLGDPVYGVPTSQQPKWKSLPKDVQERVSNLPGQALHARVLGFDHPISGKKLRFEADVPENFQQLLKVLREKK